MILKISLVAGAAFWIVSGNRTDALIGFYGLFGIIVGFDYAAFQRPKSLLDRPEYDDSAPFTKILDIVLVLIMFGLGAYVLWIQ